MERVRGEAAPPSSVNDAERGPYPALLVLPLKLGGDATVDSAQQDKEFELEKEHMDLENQHSKEEHGRKMEESKAKVAAMKAKPKPTKKSA